MKTIENRRGSELQEIFNEYEIEFANFEQRSIRLGNIDYRLINISKNKREEDHYFEETMEFHYDGS